MEKETKKEKRQKVGSWTIFDDVLRTIQERHPQLLIPLVNEIFHENYPMDTIVTRLPEEYQKLVSKVVADSCNVIGGRVYHLECQSNKDGTITLRMVEYDFMIGLSTAQVEDGEYVLRFPKSCIIYLRGKGGKKTQESIRFVFQNGLIMQFMIPVVCVQDYELDEIFDKKLYVYLPYYVMRYENQLRQTEKDEERRKALQTVYKRIMSWLEASLSDEPELLLDLIRLMRRVLDYVLRRNGTLQKEVDKIMGGKVLPLPSDKLRREFAKGYKQGNEQGYGLGRTQGEMIGQIKLILKKMRKAKTIGEIAAELEVDEAEVKPIYDQILLMGQDCNEEDVLKELTK